MQLIMYAPPLNVIGHKLQKEMQSLAGEIQLNTFGDFPSLVTHLRRPMRMETLCILIPADHHDLHRLNTIRHLMRDMGLILILPDRQAETISEGHALRPRFVSYADCPLTDVTAVVEKMLARVRSLEQAVFSRCVTS